MTTVRMLYGISGGRADGSDWPPAGGTLDCDEAEAASLVGGRLAEYVTSGAAVPAVVSPSAPEAAPEPAASASVAEPAAAPKRPIVNAPRAAWEAHALASGATQAEVDDMTKAQLIAAYGSSGG